MTLKLPSVDCKKQLMWKHQLSRDSHSVLAAQPEPFNMLAYFLELSVCFPSTQAHIISGGIAMDTSPRSSRADISSKPKSIADLLSTALVPWSGVPAERIAREGT